MQIIGPHIINGASPHLDVLRRWQPRLALILDPDADDVRALRAACPKTVVIGRIYRPDGEVSQRILADPDAAARWAHDLALGNRAVCAGLLDYVQIANEVCQFWDGLPALNAFELARMRLAEAAGAYKCALFGFSVGNPDLPEHDRMALWRRVYPAIAQAEKAGHCIAVHQYGAPDLWGPLEKGGANWLLHRLEHQVLPRLPYKRVQFAVTEYGIDGLLLDGIRHVNSEFGVGVCMASKDVTVRSAAGPAGWQTFTTAEDYVRQLSNVGQYLTQFSDRVLGYAVFTLGHNAPWASYDIAGEVARRLANAAMPPLPPTPTPTPTPGGTTMYEPEVYDQTNGRRDMTWLTKNFGARYVAAVNPGEAVFRLARINVTEGPATVVVRVQADGNGLQSHGVGLSWPDAPSNLVGSDFRTIYKPRAAVQWTDANGYTGFGLGAGSYIREVAQGGPHAAWVLHNLYQSDVLDGIGMLGGTNHVGPLHLVFDRRVDGGALTPEQQLSALRNRAWNKLFTESVAYNPDAAFAKQARALKLGVPTTNEGRFLGWAWQGFAGAILYCRDGEWDNIKRLEW